MASLHSYFFGGAVFRGVEVAGAGVVGLVPDRHPPVAWDEHYVELYHVFAAGVFCWGGAFLSVCARLPWDCFHKEHGKALD